MKKIMTLMFAAGFILLTFSCKKDKTESNTDKLTDRYWITTAMTIDPPIDLLGTPITDVFSQFPACAKDDLQKFEDNGIYIFDEGATKCDPNDPQTTTGTWAFNADETVLSVTDDGETISFSIIELSSSKMIIKYSVLENWGAGDLMYTYTITVAEHK